MKDHRTIRNKRTQKALQKEIKHAQMAAPTVSPNAASINALPAGTTPAALINRLPEKIARKEKYALESITKGVNVKKRRGQSTKKSKRTTPSQGIRESTPKHVHVEGFRWIKTIGKQIMNKVNIFRTREAKRHPSGKTRSMMRGRR